MSHFTVLVIGDNVDEQLAPYHEFECTGKNDQYVQEINQTQEARELFLKDTSTRYKAPDGSLVSPFIGDEYDPQFFRDPTEEEIEKHKPMLGLGYGDGLSWTSKDWKDGKGYRAKVKFLPAGWQEVEVPTSSVKTFAKFCEDYYNHKIVSSDNYYYEGSEDYKYGYTLVDKNGEVIKTVDRTNPNAKWDWYAIGGRWNGYFKVKRHAVGVVTVGNPGLNRLDPDYKDPGPDRANQCLKDDIDIEGMRQEEADEAAKKYDLFKQAIDGYPEIILWEVIREKHKDNLEAARKEYHEQPAIKALQSTKDLFWYEPKDFACTREEYIERARQSALTTFAVVKDGKWYERGEMGWWGVVHDEKERQEWNKQFSDLVDGLPANTLLTVVDCHI